MSLNSLAPKFLTPISHTTTANETITVDVPTPTSLHVTGSPGQPVGMLVCIYGDSGLKDSEALVQAKKNCTAAGLAFAVMTIGNVPQDIHRELDAIRGQLHEGTSVVILDAGTSGANSSAIGQPGHQKTLIDELLHLAHALHSDSPDPGESAGSLASPATIDPSLPDAGLQIESHAQKCCASARKLNQSHKKAYIRKLVAWVKAAPTTAKFDQRHAVADVIKAWLGQGDSDARLTLSHMNLISSPPLPWNVKKLDLSNNSLTRLPDPLPALTHLDISRTSIGGLTQLPESLVELWAEHTGVGRMPDSLPPGMRICSLGGHHLPALPAFVWNLPANCQVDLTSMHLDAHQLQSLISAVNKQPGAHVRGLGTMGQGPDPVRNW